MSQRVRALAAAAVTGFTLLAPAQATRQDGAVPLEAAAPAADEVRLADDPELARVHTAEELHLLFQELAHSYPGLLRLQSIGVSRRGHPLYVLAVTDLRTGEPGDKPAVLVAASLGRADLVGAEGVLATALDVVRNAQRSELLAATLRDTTLYLAPCWNPDVRRAIVQGEPLASPVELGRNFPVGWRHDVQGAGHYPLSEPESRAACEFLLAHPNIAAVVDFGEVADAGANATGAARGMPDGFDLPAGDEAIYAQLCGEYPGERLFGIADAALAPGSLLGTACEQAGAFAFRIALPRLAAGGGSEAGSLADSGELGAFGARTARIVRRMARALPRLRLRGLGVERLNERLWQVEVDVRNLGRMPTASERGVEHFAVPVPRLTVSGAVVVAAAVRPPGSVAFEACSRAAAQELAGAAGADASSADGVGKGASRREDGSDPGQPGPPDAAALPSEIPLRQVAGGGALRVRLVVEALDAADLDLTLRSPRAGSDRISAALVP